MNAIKELSKMSPEEKRDAAERLQVIMNIGYLAERYGNASKPDVKEPNIGSWQYHLRLPLGGMTIHAPTKKFDGWRVVVERLHKSPCPEVKSSSGQAGFESLEAACDAADLMLERLREKLAEVTNAD